ncbi:ferric reductase-like transmembrane domain-containing protein [Nocardioides sp.]|uniref:ferric reductase-like transmembrane domain-containing protein n=1 Tax=Nocardioides sp. TaxID=35761 RepID=UPI00271A0DFA|nr:ferric reductase-like transmembrane domain-containing protein [Nocardioides sp.]MDO9454754.1 ferric reductase-like transmembrane domain-containing protein [Nocardioides sp.]
MNLDSALWALGRGIGLVALLLLTVSLVLGVLARSGRPVGPIGRFGVTDLHRTAAMTAVGLVAVHVVSLLFDSYAQLRLVDLVVPFLGAYRPLWLGLGTLAIDVLLVVTIVSLLRQRVGPRVFRAVHLTTYALWPTALLHSLGTGTDAGSLAMNSFVALCVASVVAALGWRLAPSYAGRGRVRVERKVAA